MFSEVADKHAPIKKSRIKGIKTSWLTAELKDAMRDRDYHHRKAIKSNSEFHWNMYKKLKCLFTKQVKKNKADYYLELIKTEIKAILVDIASLIYTGAQSIAEVLNDYFSSIRSKLAVKIKSSLNTCGTILL